MSKSVNLSRRNLFNRRASNALRPPWVKDLNEFSDLCTRCDKCIDVCETKVIIRGSGGFPEIDFSQDECTFCKKCAEACPEPIFGDTQASPWDRVAEVTDGCLVNQGVMCQNCKDACDHSAIIFVPSVGRAPFPNIKLEACTGCGACVAPCPNNSIKITMPKN